MDVIPPVFASSLATQGRIKAMGGENPRVSFTGCGLTSRKPVVGESMDSPASPAADC
jgi:hypothetical protein